MQAKYEKKLLHKKVQCTLCPHMCEILTNKSGACYVRRNESGTLTLSTFGQIIDAQIRDVEQIPLVHFSPGLKVFTIVLAGDTFRCQPLSNLKTQKFTAHSLVKKAIDSHAEAIAFTGDAPITNFEFILEIATLAKKSDLKVILTTNGYINPGPLAEIMPLLDAVHLTIAYFSAEKMLNNCRALLDPILRTAIIMKKKKGLHLEVSYADNADLSEFFNWALSNLSEKTPIHLLSENLPEFSTSLPFVYTKLEQNTYCPSCHKLIIQRQSGVLLAKEFKNNKCKCRKTISGFFLHQDL